MATMHLSNLDLKAELARLYRAYLGRARDLPPALLARMGCPFLVLPDERGWCYAGQRIAIIGKLPHSWGFDQTSDGWGSQPEIWSMQQALDSLGSVDALMGIYWLHHYERPPDSKDFGQAFKRLRAAGGHSVPAEAVITNVLRCTNRERPDCLPWQGKDEYRATMDWHRGLLTEELEILRPTAAVFFTGPSWDGFLREEFVGCGFEAVEGWDADKFCRLKHPALPAYAVRAYHPGARGRSRPLAKQMLDQIECELALVSAPGS